MAISQAQVPQTTPGNVYTSSGDTAISNTYFCNYTSSAVTIDVYIVSSGDSANNDTIIYRNLSIPAQDTFVMDNEKLVLSGGDAIYASCSAANSVNATISYVSI
jgi:hypothetical protein